MLHNPDDHRIKFMARNCWMAEIGRQGGKRTSEAKRRSPRENGKKGGRPQAKLPQSLN